jgi:hypothetical protein
MHDRRRRRRDGGANGRRPGPRRSGGHRSTDDDGESGTGVEQPANAGQGDGIERSRQGAGAKHAHRPAKHGHHQQVPTEGEGAETQEGKPRDHRIPTLKPTGQSAERWWPGERARTDHMQTGDRRGDQDDKAEDP